MKMAPYGLQISQVHFRCLLVSRTGWPRGVGDGFDFVPARDEGRHPLAARLSAIISTPTRYPPMLLEVWWDRLQDLVGQG